MVAQHSYVHKPRDDDKPFTEGGATMTFMRFCRRNADIAALCGIPVAHVSENQRFGYEMGWMEEGARSPRWLAAYLRDREPVLSTQPYTVSPTLYAAVGAPFPDDAEWPSPLPTLLTKEGTK